jgi:outer membrane protein OmpA-like peptidoglycan-associated protein
VFIALMTAAFAPLCYAQDSQDDMGSAKQFYQQFVKRLLSGSAGTAELAAMVEKNKDAAQKTLDIVNKKLETDSGKKEAFTALKEKLEDGLMLAHKGPDCSEQVVGKLMTRAESCKVVDDKILFLEKVIAICPQKAEAYHKVGDLYLQERRFGMAVKTYKRALEIAKNPDTESLLQVAEQRLAAYQKGDKITVASAKTLFDTALMAPVPGKMARQVQMRTALQTKEILFDPWSAKIHGEQTDEIDAVGEALKAALERDKSIVLVIEGHSDDRGGLERNLKVSDDRAKAVKDYLVKKYDLDPARVEARGYGFFKPMAPNDTDDNRKLNRRVEFKKGGE